MSANSDVHARADQRGMTLFEILLVVALYSLLTGGMLSWALSALHQKNGTEAVGRDLAQWYSRASERALYDSQPNRVCLSEKRAELESYSPATGWQKKSIFFLLPPGITMTWRGEQCSGVLNDEKPDFLQRVSLNEKG